MVPRLRSLGVLFALTTAMTATATATATAGSASKPLTITTSGQKGVPNLTKPVKGTVTSSTFGPGTSLVTVDAPRTDYTFAFHGGTFSMTAEPTLSGLSVVGNWHITGATGSFAGMTGTGTMKGSLDGRPFVFTGHYRR
jgi:hypothetical protein